MKIRSVIYLILTLLLSSCGGGGSYVIDCEFEGLGERGIEMLVSDGRTVTRTQLHPREGRVKAKGQSDDPVLVELFELDGTPLVSCVVANGDKLRVKMDPAKGAESLVIEGTDAMKLYGDFVAHNSLVLAYGSDREANGIIEQFVGEHRDSPASALLMATAYRTRGHESVADSLVNIIDASSRPVAVTSGISYMLGRRNAREVTRAINGFTLYVGRDTLINFSPYGRSYSMLVMTDDRKPDSLRRALKQLYKDLPDKRFRILEISFADDSTAWRTHILVDTARWDQGWLPGGPANSVIRRLAIPATPYIIVCDSMGNQLIGTRSITEADSLVRNRLNAPVSTQADDDKETPGQPEEPETVSNGSAPHGKVPGTPASPDPSRPGPLKIKPASANG